MRSNIATWLASVTALAVVISLSGTSVASVERVAPVLVTVYSCTIDMLQPPSMGISRDASVHGATAVASKVLKLSTGVWSMSASVPLGHWYLVVSTSHCASTTPTVSIDGEQRTFLTALYPGDAGPLDARRNYVAGTLPAAGPVEMWMSRDGSPRDAYFPTFSGRYFYFDVVRRDDYVLVVRIGIYQMNIPLTVGSTPPNGGVLVRISSQDLRKVIACPVLSHCPPSTVEGP
jgi:hypothetical protein